MKRTAGSGLDAHLAEYYLWQEPDKGVTICLVPEMVDRLQLEVFAAMQSSTDRRAETGGILLGTTERDGDRWTTVIEDFEEVASNHTDGSTYSLSDADIANFDAALTRRRSDTNRSVSVVGYFRSHNREGLYLTNDDLMLIRAYFREPEAVFLLVKTLPTNACTAGLFFWEDGEIRSEVTHREVPFGPMLAPPTGQLKPFIVESNKRRAPGPSSHPSLSEVSPAMRPTSRPEPLPRTLPRQGERRLRSKMIAVAALVITLGIVCDRFVTSQPATSALGLHVEQHSHSLALTWDQRAPQILAAERAALSIWDGGRRKTLWLNPVQLRSAAVSYTPVAEDVEFRLQLYRNGRPTSEESIRLVEAPRRPDSDLPSTKILSGTIPEARESGIQSPIKDESSAAVATGIPAPKAQSGPAYTTLGKTPSLPVQRRQ